MVLMSLWNGFYWGEILTISVCDTGLLACEIAFYLLAKSPLLVSKMPLII